MKIRLSFVSNSSSSSFIIAAKGELTPERMMNVLGVPIGSLLYGMAQEIAKTLCEVDRMSSEDLAEQLEYNSKIHEWIGRGLDLYTGIADDDNGGTEAALCDMEIHYDAPDFVIDKDGGY